MLYTSLLTSEKLNGHFAKVGKRAEYIFSQLVKQIVERESVTEQLKVENQMEWVGQMNNIRSRATEIVNVVKKS